MENEKIRELKDFYEGIEIPKELPQLVQDAIARAEKEEQDELRRKKLKRGKKMKKQIGSIAAAMVVLVGGFAVGVNTSPAFADTVSDIPVLNSLAKVFTIETVHEENDAYVTDMKIPGIEGLKDEKLQKEINELVYNQVTAAVDETQQIMEEAKQAWLDTGGKEEEYIPREISVDYDVKSLNDKTLSFAVYKLETLASAYYDMFYYNYDLTTSKALVLSDILGKEYKSIADEQIKKQIEERSKIEGNSFFDGSEGVDGFKGITDEQQFYVNEQGNPVIVFNKYEIAPGYMGIQEFEITK